MSDVAEVKEALERADEVRQELVFSALDLLDPFDLVVDAARRWVRVVEGLDYEAAHDLIEDMTHATWDRHAVESIVDAAVGVEKETE